MKPLSESQIQKECVAWFRRTYPNIEQLFFAVPNGGARNAWTAKIMKDEGVRSGVADLILQVPIGGYASLCIENEKRQKVSSLKSQKEYERKAKGMKNKICRLSFFRRISKGSNGLYKR